MKLCENYLNFNFFLDKNVELIIYFLKSILYLFFYFIYFARFLHLYLFLLFVNCNHLFLL
jgi:hypothetical protein